MRATYRYNLTQCYLEVARGAMTQIHGKVPKGRKDSEVEPTEDMANAVFSLVSITIIYSFLALESYLNSQLFWLWERRSDGSPESNRLVDELGEAARFELLRKNSKVREVPGRLRLLCRVLGYPEPHHAIPDTWRRLKELVQDSRHFLVHPYPESSFFQGNMKRIMMETRTGAYVQVVEEVLAFLWNHGGREPPQWGSSNMLLRFRGVDLLPVQD